MLHINDMIYRIGARVLFDRATVAVNGGQRVGLVGRNGTGKSTLLRLIKGDLACDGGSISLQTTARVGEAAQEAPDGPTPVLDVVLAADLERTALLAEAETAQDPARIAEIHHRLEDIAAHAAPSRAATILHGLGFDAAAQARAVGEFSGGWRMRVALAAALFAEPDLLLLDEPSNHLDIEARLWLADYLRAWPRTLVMVSHDRDLLNAVCSHIVHIDEGKLVLYPGDYDRFERVRRERAERQAALQQRQLAQRRHMQAFVDRFRYKASKARQAQSRLKMLERMEPVVQLAEDRPVEFKFPDPDALAPPILVLDRADAGYAPGQPVLRDLRLSLDPDDRIALLGQNGNGKSTLMRLLSDRLKPLAGTARKSSKLRVGYFAQNQAEELDFDASAFELMRRALPDATPTKVRAQLGAFGFSGPQADTRVGDMSGGEKTRLLFALMTRNAPHVLLLDEPTNHLDMDSRAALVAALNDYQGAVIVVSHDAHLVRLVADRLWLVADGGCAPFEGDLDDYEKRLLQERRGGRRPPGAAPGKPARPAEAPAATTAVVVEPPEAADKRDRRRTAAENRRRLAPLRKAAETAEKSLEAATRKRDAAIAVLQDPALYSGPPERIARAQTDKAWADREVADAEERWLEAQEAYEAARGETEEAA